MSRFSFSTGRDVASVVLTVLLAVAVFGLSAASASSTQAVPRFVSVACPAVSTCSAVSTLTPPVKRGASPVTTSYAATFNPATPDTRTVAQIGGAGDDIVAVSCPSTSECVAVGENQDNPIVATYNPLMMPPDIPVSSFPGEQSFELSAISCPSVGQCTALDGFTTALTFAPSDPAGFSIGSVAPPDSGYYFQSVSCPSESQCDAAGQLLQGSTGTGMIATFDPRNPKSSRVAKLRGVQAISCVAASQCTTIVGNDQPLYNVTFNPTAGPATASTIRSVLPERFPPPPSAAGVSCVTKSSCTAIAGGSEMTFNPRQPEQLGLPRLHQVIKKGFLVGVACASTTRCVAIDKHGVHAFRTTLIDPCSLGPKIFAGNFIGQSLSRARHEIVGSPCTLVRVTYRHSQAPRGQVIAQTPAPPSQQYRYDPTGRVTLVVSSGP